MYTNQDVEDAFNASELAATRELPVEVLERAAAAYKRATHGFRLPRDHAVARIEVRRQAEAVAAAVGAADAATFLKAVYVRACAPTMFLMAIDEWIRERGTGCAQ